MTISAREVKHGTWELGFSTTAPAPFVFDYFVDFERHVEWESDLTEVKILGRIARTRGAKYLKTYGQRPSGFLQRFFWNPTRVLSRLKATESPSRIAWTQEIWRSTSDSDYVQDFELRLTPDRGGCSVQLTRHLIADDAVSAEFFMGMYGRFNKVFSNVPPAMKERLRVEHQARYPGIPVRASFDVPAEEAMGELMENLPVRGPGSRSLERLKTLLDNASSRF
jgi:hypothetical protein